MNTLYIFGASGFSREVADICIVMGYENIKFVDTNIECNSYFDFKLITESELLNEDIHNADFVIGIGEPKIREKIYNKYPNLNYVNIVHSSATMGYKMQERLKETKGNIICAGVRITNNIKLANFGIYNLNVTVGHDCILNDFVTISPGANISGNVQINKNVYIGTGSTILQGNSIDEKIILGESSIVGAGAVVVRNVIQHTVVKGIPAK